MTNILITGGTGTLGRSLTGILDENLLSYAVASRRKPPGGTEWHKMDLITGEGIEEAVAGKKIIFHLASSTAKPNHAADVDGTKRLLEVAAKYGVTHFLYISIVGIDKVPIEYYKIKLKTEEAIMASGVPYTILRATQFHDFVDFMLGRFLRYPVAILPKKGLVQPIETRAVAWKLFQFSKGQPLNRIVDLGGPEILTIGEIAKSWLQAKGKKRLILGLPPLAAPLKALDAGGLTTKDNAMECQSWQDWLNEKYASKDNFLSELGL